MTRIQSSEYLVNQYDEEGGNGVANNVSTLLEQNTQNTPGRALIARRMRHAVAIYSTHTVTSFSVMFGTPGNTVFHSIVGSPRVIVFATFDRILGVSQLRMSAGGLLPVSLLTKRGITVLKQILAHRRLVEGPPTHPVTTLRLPAVVSVIES
ncbi:hypothetical protein LTT66_31895 [Nocardia gipuzkoensis]|uniref:hypothetical protein n=1 Tax=Nocardia gipuzkoensis TaxID=2749991 RepID=UPI001E4823D6|nr:hypothetical protein [Nocardia gipuzkoensis]UGT67748.1 hypothetical protein LTT66_31895 [Nocardia gipuzkoensis]